MVQGMILIRPAIGIAKKYYIILFLNDCNAAQKNSKRRGAVNFEVRQNLYNKKLYIDYQPNKLSLGGVKAFYSNIIGGSAFCRKTTNVNE